MKCAQKIRNLFRTIKWNLQDGAAVEQISNTGALRGHQKVRKCP
jgi:hypothetical protein